MEKCRFVTAFSFLLSLRDVPASAQHQVIILDKKILENPVITSIISYYGNTIISSRGILILLLRGKENICSQFQNFVNSQWNCWHIYGTFTSTKQRVKLDKNVNIVLKHFFEIITDQLSVYCFYLIHDSAYVIEVIVRRA